MAKVDTVKVGVTVTLFFVALTSLIIWASKYDFKGSYSLTGQFDNVGGLVTGSKVFLMGVKVGEVVSLTPEGNKVIVIMKINGEIKIPKNTMMTVSSTGFVGDKVVDFFSNSKLNRPGFYEMGQTINGESPARMEDLLEEGRMVMVGARELITDPQLRNDITSTTRNINNFTGELNTLIKDIKGISESVKTLSASTNSIIRNFEEITDYNKNNINQIIDTSSKIAKNLENTTKSFNSLLKSVNSPKNIGEINDSIANVNKATKELDNISKQATNLIAKVDNIGTDIKEITGDKDLKKNLKDIVKNTNLISKAFVVPEDKNKDKVKKDELSLEMKNEVLGGVFYTSNDVLSTAPIGKFAGNLNLLAHTGFSALPFVKIGVDELGDGNLLNLQVGIYPFDNLRSRLGLIRGKLGLGGNYILSEGDTEIVIEAYDFNSFNLRLGVLQNLYENVGVSFYWNNDFGKSANEFNLGLRWQPRMF